jgi:Tfp pilus assembly protein PilO
VRARLSSLSPRAQVAVAAGVLLVYALVLWFVVVAPKRSAAENARTEAVAAELRLADARAGATRPTTSGVPVAELLSLAKAMPSSDDQTGLVLELDLLARASGVTVTSISPQEPVVGSGGATAIPVTVEVGGTYRSITRFLRHTRDLVVTRHGRLRATGRLFTVESVDLAESKTEGFPLLDAIVTLDAYVYDGPIPPPVPQTPPEESPSTGTSAAGAAP